MPATIEPAGTPAGDPDIRVSPLVFIGGQPVLTEDAQRVVLGGNYVAATTTVIHYAGGFAAGPDFLDDAFAEPAGDRVYFDGAIDAWAERYRNRIKIGQNARTLTFRARTLFDVDETGEVRILFNGAHAATLAFDNSTNGNAERLDLFGQGSAISVATLGGPGYYTITVEIRRTAGVLLTNQLIMWSLDGESRAPSTLPTPSG